MTDEPPVIEEEGSEQLWTHILLYGMVNMPRVSKGEEEEKSWGMDGNVAAELEGWLLKSKDPFPYFLLVAMEAGSLIRAIALLLAYPVAWMLEKSAVCKDAAVKVYVLIACTGLHVENIEAVGRAVLPRFLAEDVRARAWKTFSSFAASRRFVISALPRVMLHTFVRDQLGAHHIIAPELLVTKSGHCLGFLKPCRRFASCNPSSHVPQLLLSTTPTHKYLGDLQLVSSLKQEGDEDVVCMSDLQNPVMFHDGRLVQRPTPAMVLLVFLWMPLGFLMSVLRVFLCSRAPYTWWPTLARLFGIRIIIKGQIPGSCGAEGQGRAGMLLVCNHRTLLDPIFISMGLARPVTAVTYSVSRLSEILSPIPTVRLERNAEKDLQRLKNLIEKGRNVVVCPEGTTSREPLLLRFSALFALVSDEIVPVAIRTQVTLFHGTSARGFKFMDPFFFLMNPVPTYELTFLPSLSPSMTCGAGHQSRFQVANHVQQLIASTLGFHCSSFTRPDKYRFLAGTDGSVTRHPKQPTALT